ncbi:GNAT family N-acetyltransferase [Rubrimonas cliftonensis]|uniref:Phosphinothricin acetyltransferase n=1 Tax=Rubrimonas cliftonensis TaxID=89524 RepID=A0A1H3YQ24_9RHOB|nr:GNAT family N-acetyltransferase [Rubrimonas cliftonensis]SEA13477.1 phosphinothricin acetyltransferase [Rubrimonas cliftonensis]
MNPTPRDAAAADIPAITEIYARYVLETTANFEETAPDAATMAARWRAVVDAGWPWLAAEVDGALLGYAYAAHYRPRPAYRFTLEDSIYLAPQAQGRGLGSALLGALIARCEAAGARRMIAVIGDPDAMPASIALHRRFGFAEVGRLPGVGWKLGGWRDTLQMQRALGPGASAPPA